MEILIKARDAYNADPVKDIRGCYKRGDPVVQMPDGHTWGRLESAPVFWRVRLAGAPRSVVEPFCHAHYGNGIWTPANNTTQFRQIRRRWKFQPELLTQQQRIALFRGDIVGIDWQTWLRCVHDKSQQQGRGLILKAA